MMKTVLVTGGAGFIGSHLCKTLAECGYRVFSLDDYSTGSEYNHVPGVVYIHGRTESISRLRQAKDLDDTTLEVPQFDTIYHLGEYSRVEASFGDVARVWESNKSGTFAVLEYWRKSEGKTKLVYAGSSTKFADGGLGRSQSPYAWTKASNTELIENYGRWWGLPYATAYFYNAYGPREISSGPYATLIGIFKEHAKNGKPLPVVAPGTQRRNFTHVSDIVSGLYLVGEFGAGNDYGIGNEQAYSVLEVAEMFRWPVDMLDGRPGNRADSAINTEKVRALGWHPTVELDDHIHEFLQSIKTNPNGSPGSVGEGNK